MTKITFDAFGRKRTAAIRLDGNQVGTIRRVYHIDDYDHGKRFLYCYQAKVTLHGRTWSDTFFSDDHDARAALTECRFETKQAIARLRVGAPIKAPGSSDNGQGIPCTGAVNAKPARQRQVVLVRNPQTGAVRVQDPCTCEEVLNVYQRPIQLPNLEEAYWWACDFGWAVVGTYDRKKG